MLPAPCSGTVAKINLAVDRLPVFACDLDDDPQVHGGHDRAGGKPGRHSRDRVPGSGQRLAVRHGRLREQICIRPVQWPDPSPRPVTTWGRRASPGGYCTQLARRPGRRPGWCGSLCDWVGDCPAGAGRAGLHPFLVLHRQVIGPHQMQEPRPGRREHLRRRSRSLGQMFHARPAAGYADLAHPGAQASQAGPATHGGGCLTVDIPGRNSVWPRSSPTSGPAGGGSGRPRWPGPASGPRRGRRPPGVPGAEPRGVPPGGGSAPRGPAARRRCPANYPRNGLFADLTASGPSPFLSCASVPHDSGHGIRRG